MLLRLVFLYSLAAANDEDIASLLQMQFLREHSKTAGVDQLLIEAKSLALRADKNRQPLRQCDGGWQTGDGTGGSEESVGSMSQDDCVAAARDQCQEANGASYDTNNEECFCEVGQTNLDSSTTGRVNCRFFADETTDEDMGDAVDTLATLVEDMIAALDSEQQTSQQIITDSGRDVDEANDRITDHHSADTVETLETARDTTLTTHTQCQADLAFWTNKSRDDCGAWERMPSSSQCQNACPCNTNTDTFHSAVEVWWEILGDGGYETINSRKTACDTARERKAHFTTVCAQREAEAALAESAFQAARSTHLEFCTTYSNELSAHETRGGQITASLRQRRDEYDILQQVNCFINHIRTATETSQLVSATTCASNAGLGADRYSITSPVLKDAPRCLPEHVLVMKLTTNLLEYNHALWENTETLRPLSAVDVEEDAKYQTFMTSHFNTIVLCIGGPREECIEHRLQQTYNSARELFSAGVIPYTTIPQTRWLSAFDAEANGRENVDCPMLNPGFNTECQGGYNKARFGWCNNVHGQSCGNNGDSDAAIGIGLSGQNGGNTGAGHTCLFTSEDSSACSSSTVPTWLYVNLVRPTTQPPVLIMKAVTNSFHYTSPLWENDETLNPASAMNEVVDAKYAAFMSARFNTIHLCVGGPATGCIRHRLAQTYDSARALFRAGYVADNSIDKGLWLANFKAQADGRENVDCPMLSPGFNTECQGGYNKARFGWCNNVHGQSCGDNGDSDAAIGIGLSGQNGGNTGAGHTCLFTSEDSSACASRTMPTWIYVEEVLQG